MYKAVKHLDFYYMVEEDGNMYPEYIELTKEEYDYFLKRNQEYGYQTRMSQGKLISCEVDKPTPEHVWDEDIGDWVISEEALKEQRVKELTEKYNSLKQEIVFEGLMGRDTSELKEAILLIETELKEIEDE